MKRHRDASLDPLYKAWAEAYIGQFLASAGQYEAARAVIGPGLRFVEERGITVLALTHRLSEALVLLGEGRLTRGMSQLEAVKRMVGELGWIVETFASVSEATVYARIATGEAKGSIAALVRNPGFVLRRARKASRIARDSLAKLSKELPPDLEGLRFLIEFEFAKLLIKRKERDEARRHLEKAITFLQPLGDTAGMRDVRALLATLDAK